MDYKMDYQTFQRVLQEQIIEELTVKGDYSCVRHTANKNNVTKAGLSISEKGSTRSIAIYFDDFYPEYLNGVSLSQISRDIVEINLEHEFPEVLDIDFADYKTIKDKLRIRLVGSEHNAAYLKAGIYQTHPMGAEVVYVELQRSSEGTMVSRVTHSMVEEWGVPEREVFAAALENTQKKEPASFLPLIEGIDVILGMVNLEVNEVNKEEPYVLCNKNRDNGASVLLYPGMLEELHEKMGGDFYILPSSIHEVMILSKEAGLPVEELNSMIKEINREMVHPQEQLGNVAYEFQGETGRLQKCKTAEKERER